MLFILMHIIKVIFCSFFEWSYQNLDIPEFRKYENGRNNETKRIL